MNNIQLCQLLWFATKKNCVSNFVLILCYRYFITDTEKNSRTYLEEQIIPASDQIIKLSLEACEVMGIPSKMWQK